MYEGVAMDTNAQAGFENIYFLSSGCKVGRVM
jgi:hypothetical protein